MSMRGISSPCRECVVYKPLLEFHVVLHPLLPFLPSSVWVTVGLQGACRVYLLMHTSSTLVEKLSKMLWLLQSGRWSVGCGFAQLVSL